MKKNIRKTKFLFLGLLLALASCSNSKTIKLDVSFAVSNANQYIIDNKDSVPSDYRNTYHLNAPIGWINDPNGFSEYNGKYNLFYQYNPYQGVWGPMHWGHQSTKDFIKWDLEDVALAPDMDYDSVGCFSGTAIEEDGKIYLAYTAASEKQNQALAYSYGGITFKKLDKLLIDGNDLPEGYSNSDFRDPKIFKRDNKFYIICGNKAPGSKHIIMFEAENIEGPYKYSGDIYSRNDLTGIFECPDLINIENKDILIASPQGIKDDYFYNYQNGDSCVYLVGNLSTKTNKFYKESNLDLEEFDKGFSFYAPQTLKTKDERFILIAWMRSWSEPNTTEHLGWCGAMTLPRELTLKDNHLYQAPVREINNYLKDKKTYNDVTIENDLINLDDFKGTTSKISFEIDVNDMKSGKAGIELYKNSTSKTKIYYDKEKESVVIDRMNSGSLYDGMRYAKINPINGKIKLEIFLDVNSLEVFINDGYYTMTANIYAAKDADNVSLFVENSKAKFINLEKYNILVK